ncbi:hypothetical protein GCM10007304_48670 [Rhodococcoides trifolii]|uniref:O-antigen ligase domain-containing protein n=1 Tax=Rhodococcoides trifolii TaxID=908250 RepID=A0A917LJ55_9NOCA|nr:hypothetical protein [Rhodococcus trifolii]GGG29055.1 hypothetical protein GCM10007304_48670 [Rhodococcus trifolii]
MTTTSERPATSVWKLVPATITRRPGRHAAALQRPAAPREEPKDAPSRPGQPLLLLSIFLIAFGFPLGFGLTSAVFPAVMFLPRYVREVGNSKFVAFVYVGVAAMVVNGLVLHLSDVDVTSIATAGFVTEFTVVQILCIGFIVWVKRYVDVTLILVVYAIGLLLNAVLVAGLSFGDFKYTLSTPLILLVGALAGSKWYAPLAFFAVGAIGMANGARSFAAFAIAAPLLVIIGKFFVSSSRRRGVGRRVILTFVCGGVGYALYTIGTSLLLSGALGEYNRLRTVRQLNETGSLIASARPEWFATFNLMKDDPWGRGPGAVPDAHDLSVARDGLDSGGFLGGGDYVTVYMFGGRYELHSIIADLWLSFGICGLIVGVVILLYILRSTVFELTSQTARPITVFLMVASTWYLMFGPLTSNLPLVCLTVALCISTDMGVRARRKADHAAMHP